MAFTKYLINASATGYTTTATKDTFVQLVKPNDILLPERPLLMVVEVLKITGQHRVYRIPTTMDDRGIG